MDIEADRRRQSEELCKYVFNVVQTHSPMKQINVPPILFPWHRKLKDELGKIKSPSAYFGPDSEVSTVNSILIQP